MDKISIILPVFNCEKFVSQCLKSLADQTYKNFEVIMVDDESEDSSANILKEYAEKDSRFKYFNNQKNSGVSYSRNVGMQYASGDYFFFIDSDDVLNNRCLEKLIAPCLDDGADVSICDFLMFENTIKEQECVSNKCILNKDELILELIKCNKIQNFAWGKLYKKELFENIIFPVGRYYEDICTTILVFDRAIKGAFVNEKLYYYRQNPYSISKNLNIKKLNDFFFSMEEKGNYVKTNYFNYLKYLCQSFFELFYLLKKMKVSKKQILHFKRTKELYKMAVKKACLIQKIKYLIAV